MTKFLEPTRLISFITPIRSLQGLYSWRPDTTTYTSTGTKTGQPENQRQVGHCRFHYFVKRKLSTSPGSNQAAGMAEYNASHNESGKLFYIKLQDEQSSPKKMAVLMYEWVCPGLVDMYHTEVPHELRGKGIAKVLAKAALDYFCDQNVLIRPSCTYIQKYLRENPLPQYMDQIDKDFVL